MKQIAYLAIDNGIDGREPSTILYASFDESEFKKMMESDKAKNWRHATERIVDVAAAQAVALSKLDGIDRLVLNLPAWPSKSI